MTKIEKARKIFHKRMIVDATKICDQWLDGKITDEQAIVLFVRLILLNS